MVGSILRETSMSCCGNKWGPKDDIPDTMTAAGCPKCKQHWIKAGFVQKDKSTKWVWICPHCNLKWRDDDGK